MRCAWCHNPEGLTSDPQKILSDIGQRTVGQWISSAELAELIKKDADVLQANDGGVTFSGGDPLMQTDFVAEVIEHLKGLPVLMDTAGYGSEKDFRHLMQGVNLVYFDLKLIDAKQHELWTGKDNKLILRNLHILSSLDIPFVIPIPLIPGVTDTDVNLETIAEFIHLLPGLLRVDLLSYNRNAGGKYKSCGLHFNPNWDETRQCNANTKIFEEKGIKVQIG